MQLIRIVSVAIVFGLILWAINLANQGGSHAIFRWLAVVPYGDKWGHFILFGILAFTVNLALRFATFKVFSSRIYWGSAIVITFALLEEFSQYYIPARTFDLLDLAVGVLGVTITSWVTDKFLAS